MTKFIPFLLISLAYAQTPPTLVVHRPPAGSAQHSCVSIDGPLPEVADLPIEKGSEMLNWKEINANISYPQLLRDAGIPLSISFMILVDKHGYPVEIIITRSAHQLVDDFWIPILSKMRFSPAMKDDQPVASYFGTTVHIDPL